MALTLKLEWRGRVRASVADVHTDILRLLNYDAKHPFHHLFLPNEVATFNTAAQILLTKLQARIPR